MKSIALTFAAAIALLIPTAACTTEKTVYVLPDGTEVTPTAAQATQAAGKNSQATIATTQATSATESVPESTSFPEHLEYDAESYAYAREQGYSEEIAQAYAERREQELDKIPRVA